MSWSFRSTGLRRLTRSEDGGWQETDEPSWETPWVLGGIAVLMPIPLVIVGARWAYVWWRGPGLWRYDPEVRWFLALGDVAVAVGGFSSIFVVSLLIGIAMAVRSFRRRAVVVDAAGITTDHQVYRWEDVQDLEVADVAWPDRHEVLVPPGPAVILFLGDGRAFGWRMPDRARAEALARRLGESRADSQVPETEPVG